MGNKLIIGTELDTKSFEKQIEEVEYRLKQIDEELAHRKELKLDPRTIKVYETEAEKLNNQLTTLYQKQAKVNNQGFNNIKKSLDGVGNSIEKVIKKVVRWGLAIFGVRSAYLAIRSAIGILSQYDNTLKANIDYIKYSLAMILKPIIEWIINAVYKLLYYINYIAHAWFGVNLFANASAKSFAKANGNAKKLQKTMANFDDMNVLSDNNNNNVGTPSFDLSKFGDIPIPWWVDWIANNKDAIIEVAKTLGIMFGTATVLKWLGNLGKLIGIGGGMTGLNGILTVLLAIAAYELIKIDVKLVGNAIEEFKYLQQQIENTAKAGDKYNENEKKWSKQTEQKIEDTKEADRLFSHYMRTINLNTDSIKMNRDAIKDLGFWEGIVDSMIPNGTFQQSSEAIEENSNKLAENIQNLRNMYKAGSLSNEQQKQFKEILETLLPKLEEQKNGLAKGSEAYKKLDGAINVVKEAIKDYNNTPINDKNSTIGFDVDTSKANSKMNTFIETLQKNLSKVFNNIDVRKLINDVGRPIANMLPEPLKTAMKNKLGLAKGGIINQPGRGVPLTNGVIGGERGREGVIPLTDSQQMALLGESIGKYININLTNITELDGRQIARKVDKIQQNNNFVLNR